MEYLLVEVAIGNDQEVDYGGRVGIYGLERTAWFSVYHGGQHSPRSGKGPWRWLCLHMDCRRRLYSRLISLSDLGQSTAWE